MIHSNRLQYVSYFCWVCLAGIAGCDSENERKATVQGTVTIEGGLAKSGTVAFHPLGDVPAAYGTLRRDGTFVLRIGQGNPNDLDNSRIHAGNYVATVTIRGPSTPDEEFGEGAPPKPGVRLSAAKYSNKETSGLAYTVKPGMNVINIEIESPSEQEFLEESAKQEAETPEIEQQLTGEEDIAQDANESEAKLHLQEIKENSTEESSP